MVDSPSMSICNSNSAQNVKGDREVLGECNKTMKNSDIIVTK